MSISNLRKSNVSKYLPIVSNDQVIKELLSPGPNATEKDLTFALFNDVNARTALQKVGFLDKVTDDNDDKIRHLNNVVSSILVSVFHSLSINIAETSKILDFISNETYRSLQSAYGNVDPDLFNTIMIQIGEYVKIVHEDYKIDWLGKPKDKFLHDTNFTIKKAIPIACNDDGSYIDESNTKAINKAKIFQHFNQYGITAFDRVAKGKGRRKAVSYSLSGDIKGLTSDGNFPPNGRDSIFNAREIVDYKLKSAEESSDKTGDNKDPVDLEDFLNRVVDGGKLKIDEDSSSLSFIMLNNPKMRAGTKNSLELSTFFNSLSTIELSKCLPYLDVKFILPGEVTTKGGNVFQTASVVPFLEGTPISDLLTTDTYKTLEASFVREAGIKGGGNTREQNAVETNLSAFTMPQTINNFDELYVGHLESYSKELFGNTQKHEFFKRNNTVQDYTKPFLTVKSFNIDVAPTQGLMSFKTGKLSLILHDKARMADIAPFIKPDLFGSFGAEIAIKYGWSHMDAINENIGKESNNQSNYFAKFLNDNKVYEKYIITNSSYSMDSNGQVNIDLAIAMKGPVSIRAINFETDKPKKISATLLKYRKGRISDYIKSKISSNAVKVTQNLELLSFGTSSLNNNIDSIIDEFKSNLDVTSKDSLTKMNAMFKAFNNKRGQVNSAKSDQLKLIQKIQEFWEEMATTGQSASPFIHVKIGQANVKPSDIKPEDWKLIHIDKRTAIKSFLWQTYSRFISLLRLAHGHIAKKRSEQSKTIQSLLDKITDGLSLEDPFFDAENYYDIQTITDDEILQPKKKKGLPGRKGNGSGLPKPDNFGIYNSIRGIDNAGTKDSTLTSFVSLGNIILAIIGTHLSFTRGYDEVQIVSYTVNDNAGMALNKNIASLLVDKEELSSFLVDLFQNGAQYTLESLLTQIIKKFFVTRYCPNYGLRDLYKINENGNIEPDTNSKNPDDFKKVVDERLQLIHKKLHSSSGEYGLTTIKFVMPKIKLLFDTMTTDESGGIDTILRISIFDQNDNPFTSVTSIMNKVFESTVSEAIQDINSRRIALKSLQKQSKNYSRAKQEFIKENKRVLDILKQQGFLKEENGQYVITASDKYAFSSIKERLKGFMPSLTYGTHNSAIIDASISTINEAKLNTVYLTRPGRNEPSIKTRVRYKQDLPLRVLPSQANVTLFGCPFVNFAQYLFLDFETNTTVDNQYAVTGIKHEITPGKFTTQLTLSYGDAYGKYENIVDTLTRSVREIESGTTDPNEQSNQSGASSTKKPKEKPSIIIETDFTTVKKNKNLIEIKDKKANLKYITYTEKDYTNTKEKLRISQSPNALDIEYNIDNIKVIDYKNLDQVFYVIEVLSNKNDISINFKELIVACSNVNKTIRKVFYIDIFKKCLKFDVNTVKDYISYMTYELSFSPIFDTKTSRDFDDNLKFYKNLVTNQKDLFDYLIKLYLLPLFRININKIDKSKSFSSITFTGNTNSPYDISMVKFENLTAEFKKQILNDAQNSIFSFLNREPMELEYRRKKYKVEIIEIELDRTNEINLKLEINQTKFLGSKAKQRKAKKKAKPIIRRIPLKDSILEFIKKMTGNVIIDPTYDINDDVNTKSSNSRNRKLVKNYERIISEGFFDLSKKEKFNEKIKKAYIVDKTIP